MTDTTMLFTPITMGALDLPNKVLMAPLTRNRAHGDGTPNQMAETYYSQRASAGLIITEATQISAMGKGYLDTPGIYIDKHIAAWRGITQAVHAGGGRIFCQLWHVGRISHVSLLPDGRQPVSSTNTPAKAQTFTADGFKECSKPDALSIKGIQETVQDYAHAAKSALEAGFDGIEIHAANGYLIDQFLQDSVNDRTDEYGGSLENRLRFLKEVLDAVIGIWPADRIGVRLSPLGQFNDMGDRDPEALFKAVYEMLDQRGLAYLHVVEQFPGNQNDHEARGIIDRLRESYSGFYLANGDYDAESAANALGNGASAVAIGRPFIANPDLPERYRRGAELNIPDQDTFYGGGAKGYIDYPSLDQ